MLHIFEFENINEYNNTPMLVPRVCLIKDTNLIKYVSNLMDFTIDGKFHRGIGYWYYWVDSPYNSLGLTRKTSNNTIVLETGNYGTYILNKKSGSTLTPVKAGTEQLLEGTSNAILNGDSIELNGVYQLVLDTSTTAAPST